MHKYAILTVVSALALSACSRQAPEELPPPPQASTPAPPAAAPAPTGPQPGTQAHFVQSMNGRETIFFDTDRYNIDNQSQTALQAQAQYLMQHTGVRATIEGHCDERGTREYNLALGARRAAAARDFLISQGVDGNRIRTISYGKERPVAVCDNISCWSQNRRGVTVLSGAGS